MRALVEESSQAGARRALGALGLDDAKARGMRNYVSPAAMVQRAGIKPADIPVALITHLHYDHWAGHSLFPKSEFWIQKDEVAFWTGPFGSTPAFRGSANVPALADLVRLPRPPVEVAR